ncbi:MAG: GNAT family N-acetyltransferase [Bdellovibrionales bacterium]|nr:GNAT family N-acetyltransferase [Bdellovibrionales bacterium]
MTDLKSSKRMKIHSLGRRTDFIFARFLGSVEYKGNHVLVKTPSNPDYHWGNYIIFNRAPKVGDLTEWKALFNKEFSYYSEPHHYVFTWDTEKDDKGEFQEFLEQGFEFDPAIVLTTQTLREPPFINKDISIKKIESELEWNKVIKLQVLCADEKFLNNKYEVFKRNQINQYRRMSEAGMGNWFGAFLGNKLVGDLGIFYENEIARFQNVETHPDFRKRGICGTLVYGAGNIAFNEFEVETLVMEADPEYHAARIYESVGFNQTEINYALSWWQKNRD